MAEIITIDSRFNGPPTTGNGGYVCGRVAQFIGAQAEVVLLKPPPLDQALDLIQAADGSVQLKDGEVIIASGKPVVIQIEIPNPPTYREAVEAEGRYIGFENHAFPTCFVCGPRRKHGDGMRIFPGLVHEREVYASHWTPSFSLAANDGLVSHEFIWAALDCPGYFATAASAGMVAVLGGLAVNLIQRPHPGENLLVMGWKIGVDGRKRFAGTALFSEKGSLYAAGNATWFEIELPEKGSEDISANNG